MTRPRPAFQVPAPPVSDDAIALMRRHQVDAARTLLRERWGIEAEDRDLRVLAAAMAEPVIEFFVTREV